MERCNARLKENARNLVVCIDGTSNEFGDNNTNVVKLFTKIDLETSHPEQLAYYSSGIGTDPKSSNILNRMGRAIFDRLDMAVAWTVKEIVNEAYAWLAETYQEGDQIYLFGFSRGAYQVRVLASMIHEIGLIRVPTEKQTRRAFDRYEAIHSGHPEARRMAGRFRKTFSWKGTRAHFVGVWDTVSSVGLGRGNNLLSASSSTEQACHFRHALALDERRVKFMPEYFHEVNSRSNNGDSKQVVASPDVEQVAPRTGERHASTSSNSIADHSEVKSRTTDIKEVWFAGSHSDVGGLDRNGKSHHAGNVSLLWMRQEAAESGLVLKPTDTVWVPDDIDFGTSDSMTRAWRAVEYIPITHQVSFSGAGKDSRRWHLSQPRRIIPGQKVHASILYANAYKPEASLGEGFNIPVIHRMPDTESDDQFWETRLFDDTAAQELMAYLSDAIKVAPVYLDKLLFMLRFREGRQCIRNVPNWETRLMSVIHSRDCTPLVRLGIVIAYYEASCDRDADTMSPALPQVELSQEIYDETKESLRSVLAAHKHRNGRRVVALLGLLTKYQILRERILTQDVLEAFVGLLDDIGGGDLSQIMDGLSSLLQCEDTKGVIIEQLGAKSSYSNVTRLSRMLKADDAHLLTPVLRMVITLARIPEARPVCLMVKHRLKELAEKDTRLVGPLSVEILLALYDPKDQERLNIRNANVRANLAEALVHLSQDRHDSVRSREGDVDPGQHILRQLFGLDAVNLSDEHRRLIRELKMAIQVGNVRERTAATLTVLTLCETEIIRTFIREIDLLCIFINQLRRKDSALLAAYALATCLKYSDIKEAIKDDESLPKNIVEMLRLDYFDDAVGRVEGFQIFGELMQHAELREKMDIVEVLNKKLARDNSRKTQTSLIFLILSSSIKDGPWSRELVAASLALLRKPVWKAQKAGLIILSALAQTERGVAAIGPKICEIVEMLLPGGYLPARPTVPETSSGSSQTQPTATPQAVSGTAHLDSPDVQSGSPSWMMGPVCALRILARNEDLRAATRSTSHYSTLKHLYLAGYLVDDIDTAAWHVHTPNRADIINMFDKMIKAVDEDLSEEGLVFVGDVVPHVEHWDRLGKLLRDKSVAAITILPALLGVSALAVLAVAVVAPIYSSLQLIAFFKKLLARRRNSVISERLRRTHRAGVAEHEYEGEGAQRSPREECISSVHGGEHSSDFGVAEQK